MGQASDNVFADNDDLRWQLAHGVDWEALVPLVEPRLGVDEEAPGSVDEARALYEEVLHEAGRFIARECLPHVRTLDTEHPRLVDGEVRYPAVHDRIFEGLRRLDLLGISVPRELGGMGCPLLVNFCVAEMLARADVGLMTQHGFYAGIAMALLLYAALEGAVELDGQGRIVRCRFERPIRELASGEAWGAMVLTEPGAGSDLGAIRTRARRDADGVWRLWGEKIFITAGDGEHHIVLARSEPDREGLDGLSLFYVPRHVERAGVRKRNVTITKLEDKLGHSASATLSLLYDGAEAELIGERGAGFKLMTRLMNGARIAVGFEAIGIIEAAWRMARAYARERRSMGRALFEHELVADMLDEMETDLRGLRALAFEAMRHAETHQRLEMRLLLEPPAHAAERARLEERLRAHRRRARALTPLLKYLAAEKAIEITRRNMQIHGGMGYMTECGADKLLRDALVVPVYEGTSQIQALMALKDRLGGVMREPLPFLRHAMQARVYARTTRGLEQALWRAEHMVVRAIEAMVRTILGRKLFESWRAAAGGHGLRERLVRLGAALGGGWDVRRDFSFGLLHAERLTRMLADLEIARVLVRQGERFPARRGYAERYLQRMLPRMRARLEEIASGAIAPGPVLAAARAAVAGDQEEREDR